MRNCSWQAQWRKKKAEDEKVLQTITYTEISNWKEGCQHMNSGRASKLAGLSPVDPTLIWPQRSLPFPLFLFKFLSITLTLLPN